MWFYWYYWIIIVLCAVFILRILWMLFGPIPETCRVTPVVVKKRAEYRIVPEYSGRFQVERYSYDCGSMNMRWENASFSSSAPSVYEETNFATEKEAEAYIFKKLEKKRLADIERKKQEDFKTANPPREIPPFRYEHSAAKYEHKV